MQAAPLRALIALVLAALTLLSTGCAAQQWRGGIRSPLPTAQSTKPGGSSLQEVAPPAAVAELTKRLADRDPQVEILAPADEALLPEGPWTLQLRVRDWPMVAAPEPDLGPHLVIQLDQQPARHISAEGDTVAISMEALQPGSHRLTVYAVRPWGEAVKSPGAVRQIRLHRTARNVTELPARGSAQLIVASPDAQPGEEPVLIDWLLLDAPLQHLRDDDDRWRLRVSVNGDSVLVDRQTPLWLKGFQRGSNAVQLELLDGRGEPLNPPFNSIVREVVIGVGPRPAWRQGNLSANALAWLSGEPPAPSAASQESEPPDGVQERESGAQRGSTAATASPAAEPDAAAPALEIQNAAASAAPDRADTAAPTSVETNSRESASLESASPVQSMVPADKDADDSAADDAESADATEISPGPGDAHATADGDGTPGLPTEHSSTEAKLVPLAQPDATAATAASPEDETATSSTAPPAADSAATARHPASSLNGSARDQVNADGSLLQPQRRGPLAGLREKLGG